MMPAAALAAAEDALLALLAADTGLAALDGPPRLGSFGNPPPTACWIMPPFDAAQASDITADGEERTLEAPIEVLCWAVISGDEIAAARNRSATIADLVAGVVGSHRGLGIAGQVCEDAQVSLLERGPLEMETQTGFLHRLTVSVRLRVDAAP